MRNFIVLVILSVMSFFPSLANAQKHLTFKGIEMNMTTYNFVKLLKENYHYEEIFNADGDFRLKGNFTNKEAEFVIFGCKNTHIIYGIMVKIDVSNKKWDDIEDDYNFYVNLYSQKYGKPSTHIEKFNVNYNDKILALRCGHCSYATFYDIDGGQIIININKDLTLTIAYVDSINFEINKNEENISNMNDI